MPPVLPAAAGPSKQATAVPRLASRVSNFYSDDSDDELLLDTAAQAPLPLVNGVGNKRKMMPASAAEKTSEKTLSGMKNGGKAMEEEGAKNGERTSGMKSRKKSKRGQETDCEDGGAKKQRQRIAAELLLKRYELPFYQGRKMILEEIMANDTVVIVGETGCGKSTQLAQLLRSHQISLDHFSHSSPRPRRGGPSIAITQPRRLPTISLATRVAAEMGCAVGGEVGYAVRFEDACGHDTRVRFVTEGVLMRELANADGSSTGKKKNPTLPTPPASESSADSGDTADDGLNLLLRYDIVIIDEAHERTLNTDFLLGSLKKIQRIRKELAKASASNGNADKAAPKVSELKVVIMSATLDPAKFTSFFNNCPALHVPGRMFDVQTSHAAEPVEDFIEAAADCAMQIHTQKPTRPGEMLVFMPGSEEIENLVALLRRRASDLPADDPQIQVLPLYASLPPTAQAKIFAPPPTKTRRIVVATNIAETSLTIPGIGYVVDSGYKKEKEFIYRSSGAIEHLRKMQISQASAWQRTGRAGREMAGQCFRLYTEKAFRAMDEFDKPEIQRCNLASAVLQLIAMKQDPFTFEYIDPPSRDSVAAAFRTLAGLGAIESPTTITLLGRQMLRYPLDPEHARILVASYELGCPNEIIDILSLVVSGPVFVDRSSDARDTAAAARQKFLHRDGDHLTSMNVLRAYVAIKDQRSSTGTSGGAGVAAWCRDNCVNSKTLAAAVKVRAQLRELADRQSLDWRVSCGSEQELVGKCLLQGLFMNTAVIQADGTYRQTAGSLQVKIHPSSVLMSRKVPAIVYDELAITSSIYARNVSAFEQHWITEVPWFKRAGQSLATPVSRTKV